MDPVNGIVLSGIFTVCVLVWAAYRLGHAFGRQEGVLSVLKSQSEHRLKELQRNG